MSDARTKPSNLDRLKELANRMIAGDRPNMMTKVIKRVLDYYVPPSSSYYDRPNVPCLRIFVLAVGPVAEMIALVLLKHIRGIAASVRNTFPTKHNLEHLFGRCCADLAGCTPEKLPDSEVEILIPSFMTAKLPGNETVEIAARIFTVQVISEKLGKKM